MIPGCQVGGLVTPCKKCSYDDLRSLKSDDMTSMMVCQVDSKLD